MKKNNNKNMMSEASMSEASQNESNESTALETIKNLLSQKEGFESYVVSNKHAIKKCFGGSLLWTAHAIKIDKDGKAIRENGKKLSVLVVLTSENHVSIKK